MKESKKFPHGLATLKYLFLSASLALVAAGSALAQGDTNELRRSYVGIGFSTARYRFLANHQSGERMVSGVMPLLTLHYGYRLSERTSLQVGVGYDGWGTRYSAYPDSVPDAYTSSMQRTRGLAIPLTFRYTPFSPARRLKLYVNASLVPVLGQVDFSDTRLIIVEENGVRQSREVGVQHYRDRALSLTATAGLTLNYRVSNRLDLNLDVELLRRTLGAPDFLMYRKGPISVGLSLNYSF